MMREVIENLRKENEQLRSMLKESEQALKNCALHIEQSRCPECSGNGGGVTDTGWEQCNCQKLQGEQFYCLDRADGGNTECQHQCHECLKKENKKQ